MNPQLKVGLLGLLVAAACSFSVVEAQADGAAKEAVVLVYGGADGEAIPAEALEMTADVMRARLRALGLQEGPLTTRRPRLREVILGRQDRFQLDILEAGRIAVHLAPSSPEVLEHVKQALAQQGRFALHIVEGGDLGAQERDERAQREIERILGEQAEGTYDLEKDAFAVAMWEKRDGRGRLIDAAPVLLKNGRDAVVDGSEIARAERLPDLALYTGVQLTLRRDGAAQLARVTTEHEGRQLAIVLDGVILTAPVIRSPVTGGKVQVTGDFSREDIDRLLAVLRRGSLPHPVVLQEERQVELSGPERD